MAIFDRDGDLYVPTEASLSPWSDQAMHGGPPAMLLAREIERFPSDQPMFVSRLTVELLRPSRSPLSIRSRLVRPGRRVQLVEASLFAGDQEIARATGERIRTTGVEVPAREESIPRPPPEALREWSGSWRDGAGFYHLLGVEGRSQVDVGPGRSPGWVWFRLKLPLVEGEEPSGLVRICAAADFPNGISFVVDPRRTSFVNPDLTVYVSRLPVDEWVLVDAATWLEPQGTGLAEGALYDRRGRIGRSLQSILVEQQR